MNRDDFRPSQKEIERKRRSIIEERYQIYEAYNIEVEWPMVDTKGGKEYLEDELNKWIEKKTNEAIQSSKYDGLIKEYSGTDNKTSLFDRIIDYPLSSNEVIDYLIKLYAFIITLILVYGIIIK